MEKQTQSQAEKLDEIKKLLEDGTARFRSSEAWKDFLSMQSKMPDYSFNNCMLIMIQTKGKASMCMGFNSWKKLGRTVKAGEKGIRILCPAPKKITSEEEKRDKDGNLVYGVDGNPEKEKITKVIPGYKVGYTFDVSQTEGEPLPEICHKIDGSVEGAERLIEILKDISPVPLSFEKIDGTMNGYYSPAEKRIVVKEDLPPNHKIHTCLHEITHATLDLNGTDKDATRGMKETEAESVAFVVMKNLLGDQLTTEDLGQYSFGYLNSWASSDDLTEMKQAMKVIQQTSADLIEKVGKELDRIEQSEKEMAAYKVSSDYIFVRRTESGFDFLSFNDTFQKTGGGHVESGSARIDEAAKEVSVRMGYDFWQMSSLDYPEVILQKAAIATDRMKVAESSSHRHGRR
ncbi:MAG: hypothetical protein IJ796_09195 [Lachnospiraceae bacterium]|nr:hypothetical protein [Lachnospiraceae bacterium]